MTDMITSILTRTVVAGTPLLLGTLGEVITERAGILNLGVEGMMSVGAVTGFIVTFTTWQPLAWDDCRHCCRSPDLSLVHSFVTISLRANQVVSGLALTMLGLGLSGLWGKPYIGRPLPVKMDHVSIPGSV